VAAVLRAWSHRNDRIALITHGGFSSFLLRALLNVSAEASIFFHHDNTAITRVRFRDNGQISLRYLNRVTHLPPDMVT
jgi:broad specificity phosphatase PhoE